MSSLSTVISSVNQICEAKQNSGKTIWIGINSEVNMNEWKISGEEGNKGKKRWMCNDQVAT